MEGRLSQNTLEDVDRAACHRSRLFGEQLTRLLKRIQPEAWTMYLVRHMKAVERDQSLLGNAPPHFLRYAIEANMAYHRWAYKEPPTSQTWNKVRSLLVEHEDPYSIYAINKDIHFLAVLEWRHQLETQGLVSWESIGLVWHLFTEGGMPELTAQFTDSYGVTPEQWLGTCMLAFGIADRDPLGRLPLEPFQTYARDTLGAPVDLFLQESAYTPQEIGARFRKVRRDTKPRYHGHIRTIFMERPLIKFSDEHFLAPQASLLFRHAREGLYRLLKPMPAFDQFGKSIEKQVIELAGEISHVLSLRSEKELVQDGVKSCDLLLEFEDCIFLVEAKACVMQCRQLEEHIMLADGSTKAIVDGLEQILATALSLKDGVLDKYVKSNRKPVYGAVITFGEVPFANSDFYFDNIIMPRARQANSIVVDNLVVFASRPTILSLESYAMLMAALYALPTTPRALAHGFEAYYRVCLGDWRTYLGKTIRDADKQFTRLPFVNSRAQAFFDFLRLSLAERAATQGTPKNPPSSAPPPRAQTPAGPPRPQSSPPPAASRW